MRKLTGGLILLLLSVLLSACPPSIEEVLLMPAPTVIEIPAGDSAVLSPGDAITFYVITENDSPKPTEVRHYNFNYQTADGGFEFKGERGCRFIVESQYGTMRCGEWDLFTTIAPGRFRLGDTMEIVTKNYRACVFIGFSEKSN